MFQIPTSELAYCASLPIVAAIIGWVTNFIAVKMIFRPRKPIRVLGLTFHGLVPKRHAELARKIADTVEEHLVSSQDVETALRSGDIEEYLTQYITGMVDSLIKEKAVSIPLLGMFLSGDVSSMISDLISAEIRTSIPTLIDDLVKGMDKSLDFRAIVYNKVLNFEVDKLERIIYDISARELKTIELLGGLLGFVVGLAQAGIYLISRQSF
jgi:uncharacterized membrane protein YheB (UPF0754 family)